MREEAILYKEFLEWVKEENKPGFEEWVKWEKEKRERNQKNYKEWMAKNEERDNEIEKIRTKQKEWDKFPFLKKLFSGRPRVPMSLYHPNHLLPDMPFSLYLPKVATTQENFMEWLITHKYKL
jgi:hypothetical protein